MKVRRCSRFRATESQWKGERADEIVFLIPYFSQRLKWNWENEWEGRTWEARKEKEDLCVKMKKGRKSLDFLYFPSISGQNQGKKANGNSIIFFFVAATDSDRTLKKTTKKKKIRRFSPTFNKQVEMRCSKMELIERAWKDSCNKGYESTDVNMNIDGS